MGKVLIVDDEAGVREGLARVATSRGHQAVPVAGLADALAILEGEGESIDCVLLDLHLKDGDGIEVLEAIQKRGIAIPVIVATAYGDSDRTINAMKAGAFDFVTKPFDLPTLGNVLERALASRSLSRTPSLPPPVSPRLVGSSAAMLEVWKAIGRVARSSVSVLVIGETGSGKELVARAIHEHSDRASEPFVAVNVASLPASLVESELFGHEKGAFTGATARRSGRFEIARGGTIFLDEIGDLDAALQTKLLRVLQDGAFERVGSSGEILQNRARVVAATNKPVRPNDPTSTLRSDLYFRLAVVEIALPRLVDRRSDIPLLVASALARTKARAATEAAMQCLAAYDWPGNVRELYNVVERAAVMCSGELIDRCDLPESIQRGESSAAPALDAFDGLPLREALFKLERHMIERALARATGNRAEAARILGIARPQLYAKLGEHGLAPRKPEDA